VSDELPPDDTLIERLQSGNRRLAEDNSALLRRIDNLEWLLNAREVDLRRAERHLHSVLQLVDKAEKDLAYIRTKALDYLRQ
jgi:hypothetical protein